MRTRLKRILSEQELEDWACLCVLVCLGLYMLFSERFWLLLPF